MGDVVLPGNLRDVCRMVMWSLAGLEGLWTNDVTDAVAGEQNGARQLLLGVASNVAADHCQAHAEAQTLKKAQPKSHQAWPFAVGW